MPHMDRQRLSALAHVDHPIAAPLTDATVRAVLARAIRTGTRRLLDLGCGSGQWLVRAATDRPDLHATGIDVDRDAVARGQRHIADAGLTGRVVLLEGDARTFASSQAFDVVLSVG